MNNNEFSIYCPRCGAEMKQSARYCMKCGCLNYDHPDNAKFKKYDKTNGEGGKAYVVGSKDNIEDGSSNGTLVLGNNMGGKNLCFWVNMLAFLGIMLITIIIALLLYIDNISLIVYSIFPTIWIVICIYFVSFYGLELMFMKANKPWYFAFIPIYNMFVIAEMAMGSMVWGLLYFVPFGTLVINYKLGDNFGGRGILTLLFGGIDYLVIGYSSSILYKGYNYVETFDNAAFEKDYGKKSIMKKIIIVVFLAAVVMFGFSNFTTFRRYFLDFEKQAFINQAQDVIDYTKKIIKSNDVDYECYGERDNPRLDRNIFYFAYDDLKEETGIGNHDTYAYVKIVQKDGGGLNYYIYMTDTSNKITLKETFEKKLSTERIVNNAGNKLHAPDGLECIKN